jgi:hypothetical protein
MNIQSNYLMVPEPAICEVATHKAVDTGDKNFFSH